MAKISVEEFDLAFEALNFAMEFASKSEGEIFEIARDACIQRFEFCVELSWKISAKKLGSSSTTAKPVIREMAQNGLIETTDSWFGYVEARNKSSHTYDKKIAGEVFAVIPSFITDAHKLRTNFEET